MAKSADAFRTISEVSEWLDTPAHVLRFWESKFTQVKPVKRAGGRRYYRPSDMELLGGIKRLLHEDGMTIKGVQKLLREKGVAHVADLSQPLDDVTAAVRDAMDGKAQKARSEAEDAPAAQTDTLAEIASSAPAPDAAAETLTARAGEDADSAAAMRPEPAPAKQPATPRPAGIPSLRAVPSTPVAAATPAGEDPVADRVSPLAAIYARSRPLPADAVQDVAALRSRLQVWLARGLG